MTPNEARERIDNVWGTGYACIPWNLGAKPGKPMYAAQYPRKSSPVHFLDCNGHAICHHACARLEDEADARADTGEAQP